MLITSNCLINGMPEEEYHNDPTPTELAGFKEPCSLSSSTVKAIMEQTEKEARQGINRLNPGRKQESSDAMDFGSMAHDFVLLGGEGLYEIANFDDWRTKDAKLVKQNIIDRGKIPLNNSTQSCLVEIRAMKTALHEQIAEHRDYKDIMLKGNAEQSAFAFDGDIWNRARFDWNDETYENLIVDYKTTGIDIARWERNDLWAEKFYQDVHYRRVADMIREKDSRPFRFIFVLQSTKAPYLMRIIEVDTSYHSIAGQRYMHGRKKFIECTKTGLWRGYAPYTLYSTPAPWIEKKWEDQALVEEILARREKDEAAASAPPREPLIMAG